MLRIVPAGKSSCWVVPFPMILSYYYDVKIHLLFLPDLRCWELFWISFRVVPFPMIPSTRSCGGNRIQFRDHHASWSGFLHHNHVTELEKYLFQNMEGTESNWEVYIQSVPFDRGLCTSERGYWTFWTSEGAFWSFATQLARKSNREQSFTVYTVCGPLVHCIS